MNLKKQFIKKAVLGLMTLMLMVSGAAFSTLTAHAAGGWFSEDVKELKLGEEVMDGIVEKDYRGPIEGEGMTGDYYWKIYQFSMPEDGLLDIYIESEEGAYLNPVAAYDGFAIFDAAEPDDLIWRSCKSDCKIKSRFSSALGMYYGSTQISLGEGDYYFTIRQQKTHGDPYYLTLSYQKPTINVRSVTLSKKKLAIKDGDKKTLKADILPTNATNKTIEWSSSEPSVATVSSKGLVTGISPGTTTITAAAADGEISATCEVTVTCNHKYGTTIIPASTKKNGQKVVKCSKCKDKTTTRIYAVKNITLSKTSYVRNGKARRPVVTVKNSQGKLLKARRDYTISYPSGTENVGKYEVVVKFKGNYTGTARKSFTVVPKPTRITKVQTKKKGFTVTWKRQMNQSTGYEVAYSTSSQFAKGSTITAVINNSTSVSRKVSKLQKGKLYYVRVRVYTNVNIGGKEKALYSDWSNIKAVVIR